MDKSGLRVYEVKYMTRDEAIELAKKFASENKTLREELSNVKHEARENLLAFIAVMKEYKQAIEDLNRYKIINGIGEQKPMDSAISAENNAEHTEKCAEE